MCEVFCLALLGKKQDDFKQNQSKPYLSCTPNWMLAHKAIQEVCSVGLGQTWVKKKCVHGCACRDRAPPNPGGSTSKKCCVPEQPGTGKSFA